MLPVRHKQGDIMNMNMTVQLYRSVYIINVCFLRQSLVYHQTALACQMETLVALVQPHSG